MKKHLSIAAAVAFMLSLSACGTLAPPQRAEMTATTTAATMPETTTVAPETTEPEVTEKPDISEKEKKVIENNVFMTEFFNSSINIEDKTDLVNEVIQTCSFEHSEENLNGAKRINLKNDNGSGVIDVMCVDITTSDLDYDLGYIIDTFGDYYFGLTKSTMPGVTDNDFNTNYRMSDIVVNKGKYQQCGSMQRSDGMATQFGYAETYATLVDNKIMLVSGQFASTDMMDRQTFSGLMSAFRDKIPF